MRRAGGGIILGSLCVPSQVGFCMDHCEVGDGLVIWHVSRVTRAMPNNCVAVDAPAYMVRRNIAWEGLHLCNVAALCKPSSRVAVNEEYWIHPGGSRFRELVVLYNVSAFVVLVMRIFRYVKI